MPAPVVQIWSATGSGAIVSIGVAVSAVTAGNALMAVCNSIPIAGGSASTVTCSGSVNGAIAGGLVASGPDTGNFFESIGVFLRSGCSAGGQTVTVSSTGNTIDAATLLVAELPPCTLGGGSAGVSQQGVSSLSAPAYTPSTGGTVTTFVACLRATSAANAGISDPPTGWSPVYAQQNGTLSPFCTMQVSLKTPTTGVQSATYNVGTAGATQVAIWDILQAVTGAQLMGQACL
jgi:hypothetical protein